jgi:AhpD family alkylhydroperoxidase
MEAVMARVPGVPIDELPADLRPIYAAFSGSYGNFGNQVRVMAHSPSALRHICGLMMEWREQGNLPRRVVEVAVVTVSHLNRCPYCVAHHGPVLVDMGLAPEAIERILDPVPPGFEPLDVLVRDYARLVIERPWGIRDRVFEDLRGAFSHAEIVELTLRISLCSLFNQLNEAMQIEPEDGVVGEAAARGLGPALARAGHP